MGTKPIGWMAAASVVCWIAVIAVAGRGSAIAALLGLSAPLAAAIATWIIVERQHVRRPEATPGVLIKLFGAKVLFFGVFVAAVVLLLREDAMVFAVSFASQYILLHAIEALFLRRLFTPASHQG